MSVSSSQSIEESYSEQDLHNLLYSLHRIPYKVEKENYNHVREHYIKILNNKYYHKVFYDEEEWDRDKMFHFKNFMTLYPVMRILSKQDGYDYCNVLNNIYFGEQELDEEELKKFYDRYKNLKVENKNLREELLKGKRK